MEENKENFNKEDLKFLYEKYHERELFDINQIWENLKFFMILLTIFIPILTSIPFIINLAYSILNKVFKVSFVSCITVFLLLMLFTLKSNSERHYKRWAEWRGTCMKISEKLNLNKETQFEIFPEEKFLHPFKYINPTEYAGESEEIKSLENYIEVKFNFNDSFINKIKKVYWFGFGLLTVISLTLILIFLFL